MNTLVEPTVFEQHWQNYRAGVEGGSLADIRLIVDEMRPALALLEQLRKQLSFYEAAMAPIRRLPQDVLLRTFILMDDDSVSSNCARAVVGRVCKLWRTLSRSCPPLWTAVSVDAYRSLFKLEEEGFVLPDHSFLRQTLILSRRSPLHVYMSFPYDYHANFSRVVHDNFKALTTSWTDALHELSVHAYRFHSICTKSLPRQAAVQLSRLAFPKLRSLEVNGLSFEAKERDLIRLNLPPSLRRLKIRYSVIPNDLDLQVVWSNLTRLEMKFHDSNRCYGALREAKQLEHLRIDLATFRASNEEEQPKELITLPRLRYLDVNPFLLASIILRAPALRQIYVRDGFCDRNATFQIEGAESQLWKLRIGALSILAHLQATLQRFSDSIEVIHVDTKGSSDKDALLPFFQTLILTAEGTTSPYLNKLQHLELRLVFVPPAFSEWSALLAQAIESRWRPGADGSVGLWSIRLVTDLYTLDGSCWSSSAMAHSCLAETLLELQGQGLLAEWTNENRPEQPVDILKLRQAREEPLP